MISARLALPGRVSVQQLRRIESRAAPACASSAASSGGKRGPVEGAAADPNYLDVSVAPGQRKRLKVETTRNAFAYVFAGSGTFRDASDPKAVLTEKPTDPNAPPKYDVSNHSLVLFDRGDELTVQAGPEGIRF